MYIDIAIMHPISISQYPIIHSFVKQICTYFPYCRCIKLTFSQSCLYFLHYTQSAVSVCNLANKYINTFNTPFSQHNCLLAYNSFWNATHCTHTHTHTHTHTPHNLADTQKHTKACIRIYCYANKTHVLTPLYSYSTQNKKTEKKAKKCWLNNNREPIPNHKARSLTALNG